MTQCQARFEKTVQIQCSLEDGHTGLHAVEKIKTKSDRKDGPWRLVKETRQQ